MHRAFLTTGAAVLYIKGMYQPFQFFMPAQIFFGAGSLDNLGSAPLPGAKALIVIGGTSVKRLGYLDRVQALLKKQGVESVVFDKVQPNPVVEHVMEASSLARETGCDFVIGLGGGSSMDSAKSIAVMAANPGTYWDYIQGGSGKGLPIPCKPLHHHYGGNRNGGGSVDRNHERGYAGEDRFRLQGYFPHHVYRRSGVDAFRTSQINGIPGV